VSELRFYIRPTRHKKNVISDTFFPANILAWYRRN